MYKVEIKKSKNNQHYFIIKAANNKVILRTSEMYKNKNFLVKLAYKFSIMVGDGSVIEK